ncbi:MAG: site-specific integrase, partial [Gemmatimonadaceae bacterium]|nr:site-specific integrase [Gemmatimonadaceae bacterium]
CKTMGLEALPARPATIALYLTDLTRRGRRPSTLDMKLAAIAHAHRSRGHAWTRDPGVSSVRSGIRREVGVAPEQKSAVVVEELATLVGVLGGSLAELRDRSLLTMGFFGAFRRSELVALNVADLERSRDGLTVKVRRSKGDQEGEGAVKGIPYASNAALCPVRALEAWLAAAAITEGPLFRCVDRHGRVHAKALEGRSVARIVQRTATLAGVDSANLAGHSLRAGFATSAARKGKSLDAIMRQTLHKSPQVARSYIRHAQVFDDNAATGIA